MPIIATNAQIIAYYTDLLTTYGLDARSLDWGSADTQRARFAVLASVCRLAGRSVLDVGCGLGDFYAYLRQQDIETTYTGLDLTPAMIDRARERFPQVRLHTGNLLEYDGPGADVVVASGLFAFVNLAQVVPMLQRMVALCGVAVACNFLSDSTPVRHPREFYADPGAMLRHARRLTPYVTLRHDYMHHDFTLFLYREPVG